MKGVLRRRIAWHFRATPWEAVDYLTGCRIRWVCDRHERAITSEDSEETT